MIICAECLTKEYLNAPTDMLDDTCSKCEQLKPCAHLADDRMLKKRNLETMEEKPTTTPKTPRRKRIKPDIAEPILHEVIEVEAIDDAISKELGKHNITESALIEMETKFPALIIEGLNDKEGYKAVHDARIMCRNTRTLAVDICKTGREKAIKEQKDWITTEKKVVNRIKAVEENLYQKEKAVDDEKDRIKREEDERKQKILQQRSVQLIKFGMDLKDDAYVLDDIKISVLQVKEADDFTFNALIAHVEKQYKENEERKAEERRIQETAAAEAKRQAEENIRKAEELKKQEESLAARQKAIEDAEIKAKKEEEARIEAKQAEEKAKIEAEIQTKKKAEEDLIKARKSALFQLGFSQQNEDLYFKELVVKISSLPGLPESKWETYLFELTQSVEKIKERLETERKEREEKIRQEAADKAKTEADAAAKKKEEERLAAEKENARLASLQPDVDKLKTYLTALSEVPIPEFSTEGYKQYSSSIKSQRTSFLTYIFTNKPQ